MQITINKYSRCAFAKEGADVQLGLLNGTRFEFDRGLLVGTFIFDGNLLLVWCSGHGDVVVDNDKQLRGILFAMEQKL